LVKFTTRSLIYFLHYRSKVKWDKCFTLFFFVFKMKIMLWKVKKAQQDSLSMHEHIILNLVHNIIICIILGLRLSFYAFKKRWIFWFFFLWIRIISLNIITKYNYIIKIVIISYLVYYIYKLFILKKFNFK